MVREKEDLVGKVALLDGERMKVIDELTSAEQNHRETIKVKIQPLTPAITYSPVRVYWKKKQTVVRMTKCDNAIGK